MQQNHWGLKTPLYSDGKAFLRTIAAKDGSHALDDNEAVDYDQDAKIEDIAMSTSSFLFRRRRRSPPPPVVQKPIIIHTNTFKMNFYAKDVKAIRFTPGDWFDRQLIQKYAPQMGGWFGPQGQFPLLPQTAYVAYQPRVEIIVSESQFGQLKNDLENKAVIWWLVGGAHFRKPHSHPMSDNGEQEEGDLIYWEEITPANETAPAFQAEKESDRKPSLLSQNEAEEVVQEEIEEIKALSNSDFLFRRRRRRSPPPPPYVTTCTYSLCNSPPPPPPKIERNFRVVFDSKSSSPQILGVVSELLP